MTDDHQSELIALASRLRKAANSMDGRGHGYNTISFSIEDARVFADIIDPPNPKLAPEEIIEGLLHANGWDTRAMGVHAGQVAEAIVAVLRGKGYSIVHRDDWRSCHDKQPS